MRERKNTIVERDGRLVNPNRVQTLLNITVVALLPRVQLPFPFSQIETRYSLRMIKVVVIVDKIPLKGVKELIQNIEEEIRDATRGSNVHMNPLHPYHPGQDQAPVKKTRVASQMMLATDLTLQVTVWNQKG
jgi:hypothetical protein